MEMKAGVINEPGGAIQFETVEIDDLGENEILVRIVASGICHTDLTQQKNAFNYPILLGHEGSGIVERVGAKVSKVKEKDKVILSYTYCGECEACLEGRTYECNHLYEYFEGLRLDDTSSVSKNGRYVPTLIQQGSFAEYVVASENSAVVVNYSDVDLTLLGPLGCGLMAGAGSVLNYLKPHKGESLVITGAGTVGLAGVMAGAISGCYPIIVMDKNSDRLTVAKKIGATHTIDTSEVDVIEGIQDITQGVDNYFDTTGYNPLLEEIKQTLSDHAKTCGVGIGGAIHFNQAERNQGKRWVTTNEGWATPQRFIPELLNYHAKGMFPFDTLTEIYPMCKINEALQDSKAGLVIKPVVVMRE